MSKKAPVTRRRKLPPVVAAIVLPVAKRLARIEALLLEMRHEQDMKLKKLNALEIQVETLTEHVRSYGRTGEPAKTVMTRCFRKPTKRPRLSYAP